MPRPLRSDERELVRSVHHALLLLELVRDEPGQSLSQLSGALGLVPSTALRLLSTVEAHGLVERDVAQKTYRLGWGAHALGRQQTDEDVLIRRLGGLVKGLAADTREHSSLAVLRGTDVVHLVAADRPASDGPSITVRLATGRPLANLHALAVGKILLAFSPARTSERIIQQLTFTRTGSNTIRSAEELQLALAQVRKDGFAFSIDENSDDVRGVSAPIYWPDGRVAAALAIMGPATRISQRRLESLVPQLIAVAGKCTLELRRRL